MLIQTLLVLGNRGIILLADVVDEDNSIMGTTGNQIRIFHAELAGSNLAFRVEDFLRESRVL